jgi:hypothetical protein
VIEDTTSEAGIETRHRRAGRGLGPFSGGQLTIIIVTFAGLLLFPVGAWALSFTNVAITDPGGVNRAKVDTKNNLNTAIHDPVSGTAATVESGGKLKVDAGIVPTVGLGGSITANVAYPTGAIVRSNDGLGTSVISLTNNCGSGRCPRLIAPPTGMALVVTSIHVNTSLDATPNEAETILLYLSADGTCNVSSIVSLLEEVNPSGLGVTDLRYDMPGGMTIPAGNALCGKDSDPTNLRAVATAWGYAVPSTAVPTAALRRGAPTGAALLKPH